MMLTAFIFAFYALFVFASTRNIYIQVFLLWIGIECLLRFHANIEPHPIITLLPIVLLVFVINEFKVKEGFNLTEGNWEAVKECKIPFNLYQENPWTSPDEIAELRVINTLNETENLSKSIEDFLQVNRPDSIASASA